MKRVLTHSRLLLWFLLGSVLFVLSGCATTDSENASERPWNAPKSWENGMPSTMMEGR